jgi:taurine dioxygenase
MPKLLSQYRKNSVAGVLALHRRLPPRRGEQTNTVSNIHWRLIRRARPFGWRGDAPAETHNPLLFKEDKQVIKFTRLSWHIGADVHGVDLSQPLHQDEVAAIREGLIEHLVLFFREQPLLTIEQHKALAGNFGELEPTTYRRGSPDEMVQHVEGTPGMEIPTGIPPYHSDSAYKLTPSAGSFLQAHILPKFGGDTCFASSYAAYEALSPPMRSFLDGLEAYNSLDKMHSRHIGKPSYDLNRKISGAPPVKTPVVRTHPDTGRKFLNVNVIYTSAIAGLREDESDLLLRFLFDHIRRPEFGVRLHWNVGDVTYWDNWSTQHCGVSDYDGHRLMKRVSVMRPGSARESLAA